MKYIYITLVALLLSVSAKAQQEAQYTQYMYNTVNVNPAYAGSRGALSITGLTRTQWVGVEGAPNTQTLSAHTPFKNSRVGLGLSFINDEIGPTSRKNINVDFSYTIPTSETGKLSFGLKAVGNLFNLDVTKLSTQTSFMADNNLNNVSSFNPNVGLGVYYHTNKFYVGLSAPSILKNEHYNENGISVGADVTNYYFISGYVFKVTDGLKLKPAVLAKLVQGAPLQVDASLNALIKDKFTLGAAYRFDAAVSGLAGFQVNKSLFIGYAYDFDTTELSVYNKGSHELMLRFELFDRKAAQQVISPRFF